MRATGLADGRPTVAVGNPLIVQLEDSDTTEIIGALPLAMRYEESSTEQAFELVETAATYNYLGQQVEPLETTPDDLQPGYFAFFDTIEGVNRVIGFGVIADAGAVYEVRFYKETDVASGYIDMNASANLSVARSGFADLTVEAFAELIRRNRKLHNPPQGTEDENLIAGKPVPVLAPVYVRRLRCRPRPCST